MAKFRMSNDSVLSIGGNAITCVTDIEFSENADVYFSRCDDANGYFEPVVGGIQVTGTATFELETDDVTVLGYIDPLTSGALICQPNGTTSGDIKITATTMTINSRDMRYSRSDMATGQFGFTLDGLTIAANT